MCSFNPNTTDYYLYNGQHVHELIGSTVSTRCDEISHSHRFAAMSAEAIPANGRHFHNVTFRTDTQENHYHEFHGTSSLAIPVGDGLHIHFVKGYTSPANGHAHEFRVAFLLNSASDEEYSLHEY